MTPVEVLEKRRDELMLDATEAEGFAAQQEANARQYRGTAAVRRQEAADLDAAILSLQQPWKAAPVPEPEPVPESEFEARLSKVPNPFRGGKRVA
jgi:hypothetical protein